MGEECPWCMGYGTQFWEQVWEPVESGEHVQEFKVSGAGPRNFTPCRSKSRCPYIGSPLNVSYAEFFRFMLQFLCLQMCVYGGSAVPQGGVGDRHLVTVPQGVVGDRLPWGGERQGGGGYAFGMWHI